MNSPPPDIQPRGPYVVIPSEPPCPTCGNPPASMIEDGYSIDLIPWWKHYLQKFNPFRLIRRQTEFRWVPMGENDQAIWSHEAIAVRARLTYEVKAIFTHDTIPSDLDIVSHWCPLPPLP